MKTGLLCYFELFRALWFVWLNPDSACRLGTHGPLAPDPGSLGFPSGRDHIAAWIQGCPVIPAWLLTSPTAIWQGKAAGSYLLLRWQAWLHKNNFIWK